MNKTGLTKEGKANVLKVFQAVHADFLHPARRPANVVGMGIGVKWKNGKPTGKPALIVLVSRKISASQLAAADIVPAYIDDFLTDVIEIGVPSAIETDLAKPQTLNQKTRPAYGGYSVGHINITAGTIATCCYDILNNGVGIPAKYYILSNNHVLANENNAAIGDPILQPGPYDGGEYPVDQIATLSRYVPITFNPPTPLEQQNNLVDAAVAEGPFDSLNREIFWEGYVRGWRKRVDINVGTIVQKTGRTSNYSVGTITAINAIVDVNYSNNKVARFKDQIVTSKMISPGDSGSLMTTLDNVALGLFFAASDVAAIANQFENVRNLLQIEIAPEVF